MAIKKQELERYLWGAATLLRGVIDAGDYKQYIFPLLFYKRICDVYKEEYERALNESGGDKEYAKFDENHRFQIPKGAHWNDVRQVTVNVGDALQKALRKIEKTNEDRLFGIFGDASWTNKSRLSDEILIDLLEHFSEQDLSIANVPNDELGNAYEFLIKKFADDSGHTAAEFYTNRTVVRLMSLIMNPQPGESVYDPTCGSGGLLLNCVNQLKDQSKEYRTLKLYGQELNLMTSSIARMNMFLHGIEDFHIERGDTLSSPKFLEDDKLKTFDVILANPPYSVKRWNRDAWTNDPYGRNIYGTPPQGCADYAFEQHILKSLDKKNGRSIVLWPHGVLFRDSEREFREKMLKDDVIEAVIGLGPNLFYNSPMEACLLVCRWDKPKERKGRVLFINAVKEVTRQNAFSFLEDPHVERIHAAFKEFIDIPNFTKVIDNQNILNNNANLNIPLYISTQGNGIKEKGLRVVVEEWSQNSSDLKRGSRSLLEMLDKKTYENS
ncbi:MAG: DNA methyltransferase [Candidatus Lloydbacteria bacterium RIFCSPHIGHO2_01_FULL_49_22]|uniref:site-specific DNA-methyltransferase (adenine-specific) n=1 Tax=Candidatus Lloydbacteria bacterium RIFCSPHIGHO2_01_FULL_49_22 TaxID=1798658 RepID=A0A1G2CVT5_9BACT|nr:MAG: DNA methyltransferase [Candidatus Lloydbacteria bacterium RIFCSPHIGHO2_01_FULL_49_22]OGZ09780.1 MAG: DNA methyltransferase [Candidatus Lloydbacteria bacterium RIFCSPHIGHO2_02_FULL_50_18]